MKAIVIIFTGLLLIACEPSYQSATRESVADRSNLVVAEQVAGNIDAELLREQVVRISADQFEGRAPASPGDIAARAYLAQQLEQMGYKPGAPGGNWQQPFDLVGIQSRVPETWVFTGGKGNLTLHYWDQYIASSGVQSPTSVIEKAEVVFVGYGIVAPEYQWDDYKGMDLRGKVLLMLNNDPEQDPQLFQGKTRLRYGRWDYKYESAAAQGAAGAIIIHTTASAGYPFQVVQSSWSGEEFQLPAGAEPHVQVAAWVTEDAARQLTRFAGQDLDALISAAQKREFHPVALGVTTSLDLPNTIRQVTSANVLGILPGSDPALADEVVVYTAHHDHFGIGKPDADGDDIYNGALDNGAGVAQVMAIASAFKALPQTPRRSVLIAFVGAEEQGLLGSKYYADHPTFAPGKIAANINFDGGNIWGKTRDLTFIGYGKSTIDGIVDAIAAQQGRMVKPDQMSDRGYFYRSDQYNFARLGVPALYLKAGTDYIGRPNGWGKQQVEYFEAHHYHQPSDELTADWNFDGMVEDARVGFLAGWTIANDDELPAWNPGDEFEAARLEALSTVENWKP
ncbi:MAG: peptidase M28 [Gammaproteobacteria bacterium]|nr:peptidase M28 [Gammaproteobacteria bacterium]